MKKALLISALFILGISIWMMSGEKKAVSPAGSVLENVTASSAAEDAGKMPQVRVLRSHAVAVAADIAVNGQTEASRSVDILAETEGRVVEIPAARGARVEEGQIIARIELRDRKALAAKARQEVKRKEIEYAAAEGLSEKGYNSKVRLATARAELEAARAELKRAEVDLENTEIRAPFAGILEARQVELGSFVQPGTPVARVVDLDPVRVTGFVSEQRISEVKNGDTVKATLPGGREVEGRISFISAAAETATRTFRVEAEVPNPDMSVVGGLTAMLRLRGRESPAHALSPAVLGLDDQGKIGVKTVEADGTARFHPVEIAGDAESGVWVRGLPEEAIVIVTGQEYVSDGQKVRAVENTEPTP